ncbi:hypothetical protein [Caballeronia sp. Lep1P3]|uniref:hypothetical protein n=1 Tax=Caballeronia sp. Lep1P3 TaxID=2878150 RepID=UPI001FD5971E|nr:hypothetical protein [Caballeronia sp. Lep1P3]
MQAVCERRDGCPHEARREITSSLISWPLPGFSITAFRGGFFLTAKAARERGTSARERRLSIYFYIPSDAG